MRIVIPISSADTRLLPDFLSVMEKFGGLQQHQITIIPQPAQLVQAHEASARLAKICPQVEVISMGSDLPPNNWPVSCNHQFFFAATQMNLKRTPWFWMELDTLPIKPNWANDLTYEYGSKGALFLGNIHGDSDGMMMGVAVYHPDAIHEPLMADLVRGCSEPFDYYLRWAWKRHGYANSEILCDQWNTVNYRRDGDSIVCDAGPAREMPARPRGGVIQAAASIVHGCKDGSLARLLLGAGVNYDGGKEAVAKAKAAVVTALQADQKNLAELVLDAWWKELPLEAKTDLRDYSDSLLSKSIAPVEPEVTQPPLPTFNEEIVTWVKKRLKAGNLRISAFAKQWNMDATNARAWLEMNNFKIVGPGWIKKK